MNHLKELFDTAVGELSKAAKLTSDYEQFTAMWRVREQFGKDLRTYSQGEVLTPTAAIAARTFENLFLIGRNQGAAKLEQTIAKLIPNFLSEPKELFDKLVEELGEVSKIDSLHGRIMGMAPIRDEWTAQVSHLFGNGDEAMRRLSLDFYGLCVHAAHSQAKFEQALAELQAEQQVP